MPTILSPGSTYKFWGDHDSRGVNNLSTEHNKLKARSYNKNIMQHTRRTINKKELFLWLIKYTKVINNLYFKELKNKLKSLIIKI